MGKALRASNLPPGQHIIPYCVGPNEAATPEKERKFADGPVGVMCIETDWRATGAKKNRA